MKLEEAIGRLRTSGHRDIERHVLQLGRCKRPKTRKRLMKNIAKLQEARALAAELMELLRDREWAGRW